MLEASLYPPVKVHLEALGYTVKAEIKDCDAIGVMETPDGPSVVAVELKVSLGLPVLYQALRRLPLVDLIYVAVGVPEGRKARATFDAALPDAVRLVQMLGLGLLTVRDGILRVECDPSTYVTRKAPRRRARLLSEFTRRSGDYNVGGTTRCPRVTAYREDALRCASTLAQNVGPMRPSQVRKACGVVKASTILRGDVYGWFTHEGPGSYSLAGAGRAALVKYANVVAAQALQAM